MINQFKIGDKVEITNPEHVYSIYEDAYQFFGLNYNEKIYPKINEKFKIIKMFLHPKYDNLMFFLKNDRGICLMDYNAFEKRTKMSIKELKLIIADNFYNEKKNAIILKGLDFSEYTVVVSGLKMKELILHQDYVGGAKIE